MQNSIIVGLVYLHPDVLSIALLIASDVFLFVIGTLMLLHFVLKLYFGLKD